MLYSIKNKKNFIFLIISLFFLIIPFFSITASSDTVTKTILGNETGTGLKGTSFSAGYNIKSTKTPTELIGTYIQYALSFLGVVFLILIIYAGFIWMLAKGNDTEVQKAKDIMINAGIGLVVVLMGYALSIFIISALAEVTTT